MEEQTSKEVHSYDSNVEVLQLRFTDSASEDSAISAWELAQSIEGVAEFAQEMARKGAFGEGLAPEVKIRPIHEGSILLDFIMPVTEWAQENPEGAVAVLGAGGLGFFDYIRAGINKIKGEKVKDFEYLDDKYVKVTWQNGEATQVTREAWDQLQTMPKRTRKNLEKILTPLNSGSREMEVRSGNTSDTSAEILKSAPASVVTSDEYHEVVNAPVPEETVSVEFTVEFSFENINFADSSKWRISSNEGNRQVALDDDSFQNRLDEGYKIGKDDLYEGTIKETITVRGGRRTSDWVLKNVRLTRKASNDHTEHEKEEHEG